MANDLNLRNVIGRLGRDPETRQVGGTSVCSFSIAVRSELKDKQNQKQEHTEWVRCSAWGALGEVCQKYLDKGKQVYISGQLKTDKYKDPKSGEDRYSTWIVVQNMQMLGGKSEGGQGAPRPAPQTDPVGGDFCDDIPFSKANSYP